MTEGHSSAADQAELLLASTTSLGSLDEQFEMVGKEAVHRLAGNVPPESTPIDARPPHYDRASPEAGCADDVQFPILEALKAGASGFMLKDAPRDELVDAVRTVAAGDQILSPAITRAVIGHFVRRRPPDSGTPAELSDLTTRELDVTRLVTRGLSNAEIASRLGVRAATAKSHVGHILNKLGLRDRIHLVVLAYECGLVEPGQ